MDKIHVRQMGNMLCSSLILNCWKIIDWKHLEDQLVNAHSSSQRHLNMVIMLLLNRVSIQFSYTKPYLGNYLKIILSPRLTFSNWHALESSITN